jgi:hypothetical protein
MSYHAHEDIALETRILSALEEILVAVSSLKHSLPQQGKGRVWVNAFSW